MPARSLDFWFDYSCPFAYLGWTQAREVAKRMGVLLGVKPLLLGGVFKAVGTAQDGAPAPWHDANRKRDTARWAAKYDVPFRWAPEHPMRTVEAQRATIVTGVDHAVVDGFFRAYWVENRPISTPEVISEVVARAGHDPKAVLAKIAEPAIKDELRARTDEAVRLGIFGVPTWIVDGSHLYWGQDRIPLVEGVRREHRVREASPSPSATSAAATARGTTIEMYWDFSSPFAYLASTQIEALAKRVGRDVVWHPLLLGGLFKSLGTADVPLATFCEAKMRHTMNDLARWAAYWQVPFAFPQQFPTNSLKALRTYLALPEDRRGAFRAATYRAYWAEGKDITKDETLAECIGDESVARAAFARTSTDEVKTALRESTERAAARGVFGLPAFFVDNELYWGQDRLELALGL